MPCTSFGQLSLGADAELCDLYWYFYPRFVAPYLVVFPSTYEMFCSHCAQENFYAFTIQPLVSTKPVVLSKTMHWGLV